MRKYIKPELEIISFKVEADIMINPTTMPMATVGAVPDVVSYGNVFIDDFSNKAWTSVDEEDWTWSSN